MRTRPHILPIVLAAMLTTALGLPAQSLGEYYVPPSNSAANQYTESYPGAGGESGGKREDAHPGTALGARNAQRLEEHGPAGKAAAEVAAETAPPQLVDSGGGSNGRGAEAGSTDTGGGGGDSRSGEPSGSNGGPSADRKSAAGDSGQPQGSSGLGEVLGEATGVGDGNVGPWLPLAILLALVGSIAYAARVRERHGHSA
jgi:hypothetical protein